MSLEVTIEHLGAHQFEIRARNHTVICDQPEEGGGFDEGITPPELLLASLGACAGHYAADYLRRNHLLEEGTRVRVTAEKVKDPAARLDHFRMEVEVPRLLTPQHHAGLERAIGRCLVHNTLSHPPKIALHIAECPLLAAA